MATIQGVYVALFGRPADPAGLAFFNTATNSGADLTAIGDLASTAEYKARFDGFSNTNIVETIYQSLFNRAPEQAGLDFFVDALNKGTLTPQNIAIAILDGAQGADKTIVDTKIAAADAFTAALDTPAEIADYTGTAAAKIGIDFLAPISTTAPTAAEVTAGVKKLTEGGTVTLTVGADVVNTTSTTATLKTTNNDDTIDGTANANSFETADKIDGGLGTDTLNASIAAATTPAELKSVEKLFITSTNDAATVDLANATGVTQAWNKGSGFDLTISNLDLATTIGLEGTVDDAVFSFKAAQVTGSSDSATLAVKGATVATAVVNSIETLNIATSGTASTLTSLSGDKIKDVVITGDIGAAVTIAAATLKTVDASGVNGSGVTLDVQAGVTGVTVTGTKFSDAITLDAAAVATDKDVVVYNAGNVSTQSQKDTITNFTTGEDKLNLSAFALTGGKAAVTAFGAAPVDGASFLGNAVGTFGNDLYADVNNDGVFNAATDMLVDVAGIAIGDIVFA